MPSEGNVRELSTVPFSHGLNTAGVLQKGKQKGERGRENREKRNFYHTDTTGSYVGSHHDWALARLEFVQDPISFLLLLVTVNG